MSFLSFHRSLDEFSDGLEHQSGHAKDMFNSHFKAIKAFEADVLALLRLSERHKNVMERTYKTLERSWTEVPVSNRTAKANTQNRAILLQSLKEMKKRLIKMVPELKKLEDI